MSWFSRLLAAAGRAVHPLFNPHHEWLRDRVETILAEQRRDLGGVLKSVERQQKQLDGLDRELEHLRTKTGSDLASVRKTLAGQQARIRRQLGFSERVLKRAVDQTPAFREERVLDRLDRIARSGRPVLVGPWTGEVGFELAYWTPFVRWAAAVYGLRPERLIVCSRGGPASWYAPAAGSYVDVFSVASQDEFRRHTVETPKQRTLRQFDRDVLRRVRTRLDGPVALLHPAMMYHLFMPFWKQQAPMSQVLRYSQYARIEAPPVPPSVGPLPQRYAAVRFYFSNCFPDTPDNRAFVARTLAQLAEEIDVVVLSPGLRVDDHADTPMPQSPRIHHVAASMQPETNLELQTAIIGRAVGFIGTYGGYSYLAPLCGVPTIAVYSERNFYLHHLHMAQHGIEEAGGATLAVVSARDAGLLRALSGRPAPLSVTG